MSPDVLATQATDLDFYPAIRRPGPLLLSAAIPGEPKAKQRPVVARGRTFTPAATQEAETALRWALRSVLRNRRPTEDEVGVELAFFCATSRKPDLDNLVKLVLDAANGFVWADDAQVVNLRAALVRGAAEPRTLFRVWIVDRQETPTA